LADLSDESGSRVQLAYETVREAVVSRALTPGERVTVRPFTERLAILEREGFLVAKQNSGFFVAELTLEDMRDIYELRSAVDALAARDVARTRPAELLDRLPKLLAAQYEALANDDVEAYAELDREFHSLIWSGSRNRRLHAIADLLGAQLRLGQNFTITVPGRPQASLDEHREIVDAVLAGDTSAAEQATRRHVAQVIRALENVL
jgi:DNA-binding GntR family transcriptional regulator